MRKRLISITCPNCHASFEMARDTYLIAGMDETAEKRMDERSYFTHLCNTCQSLFSLRYPFYYRDGRHKFHLLYCTDARNLEIKKGELVVSVENARDFYTARIVLQAGMKLEEYFLIAAAARKQLASQVQLESIDTKNHVVWFETDGNLSAVSYKK